MRREAAAIVALILGCGEEASVGSTSCTAANACQSLTVDTPISLTAISTRNLTKLDATWTMNVDLRSMDGLPSMASASHGGVWMFASEASRLSAKRIDTDGKVVGEQHLMAPSSAASGVRVLSVNSHALGPALHVQWFAGGSELLVFEDDVTTPAKRIDAKSLYDGNQLAIAVYRAQRGDSLFLPSLANGISAIDLQGRLLWRQALPSEFGRSNILLGALGHPDQSSALDADGALLLNVNSQSETDDVPARWRGMLIRQPADGSESTVVQYSVAIRGDATAPSKHTENNFARDPRGRYLFAQEMANGDVAVLRVAANSADGFRVLKDDHSALSVEGTALDAAGTLHVAMNADSDVLASPAPVLCSFPMDGAPVCSSVSNSPGTMQAPAPGVVMILGLDGLNRYDRR